MEQVGVILSGSHLSIFLTVICALSAIMKAISNLVINVSILVGQIARMHPGL